MFRGAQVAEAGERVRARGAWGRTTASGPGRWSGARNWLAAALAVLGLVIAGALSVTPIQAPITFRESGDGLVVASVAVGSEYWLQGVKPGMAASMTPGSVTGEIRISLPAGDAIFYTPDPRFASPIHALLGLVLAGCALLVRRSRLPGSALLLGAGLAIALNPIGPLLGVVAATPLVLLPVAAAVAAVRIPTRRWQLSFDAFGILALALMLGAIVALLSGFESTQWKLIWTLPFVIAVGVGAVGELFAVRVRLTQMPPSSDGRLKRILSATVPLASDSRLQGAEDERARIAIDIHNRLLPRVETSVRSIKEAGLSPDETADQLDELAAELRGVMQHNQTVSLEMGGVAEALKADVAAMDKRGVLVTFLIRGDDAARPPAKVELAAYRIGQAAIDNALRHSGGDRVEVTVTAERDRLDLTISDDGVGVDGSAESEARQRGRIGLAQMRLRAEAVGATVDIKGQPGAGTTIHFLWVG